MNSEPGPDAEYTGGTNRPPDWTDITDQEDSHPGDTDRAWVVLFDEDYATHMFDGEDNLAILLDHEQAHELKRLAENAIEHTERDND